jgi:SNF2 family DNA or RNA helicase
MKLEEIKKTVDLKIFNDAIVYIKKQKKIAYKFHVNEQDLYFEINSDIDKITGKLHLNEEISSFVQEFKCNCDEFICRHKVAALIFLNNEIFQTDGQLVEDYIINPNYNVKLDSDSDAKFRQYYINKIFGNAFVEAGLQSVELSQKLYLYKKTSTQEIPSIGFQIGLIGQEKHDVTDYSQIEITPKFNWTKNKSYGSFNMDYTTMYFNQQAQNIVEIIEELSRYNDGNKGKRFLKLNEKSLFQYLLRSEKILVALNSKSEITLLPKLGYDYTIDFYRKRSKTFAKIKMKQKGYWSKLGVNGENYYIVDTIPGQIADIYLPKNNFERYISDIDKINKGEEYLIEIPDKFATNIEQIVENTINSKNAKYNFKTNTKNKPLTAQLIVDSNKFGNLNLKLNAKINNNEYFPSNNIEDDMILDLDQIEQFEEYKTSLLTYGKEAYIHGEYNVTSTKKIIEVLSSEFKTNKPDFLTINFTQAAKDRFTVIEKPKIEINIVGDLLNIDINIKGINKEDIKKVIQKIQKEKDVGINYIELDNGKIVEYTPEIKAAIDQHHQLSKDNSEIVHDMIKLIKAQAVYSSNSDFNYKISPETKKVLKKITTYKQKKVKYNSLAILRDYQINGVGWMKQLSDLGFSGILADDMGLGKTIQVITFITNHLVNNERVIIIMPKALLYNWKNEIEKFAPELSYKIVDGNASNREKTIKKYINDLNVQVLLTTYSAIQKDSELFKTIEFSHIFIDEAQHIKNPISKNHLAVKKIRAKTAFALTGTPIENNLVEFWSIFNVLLPGLLGTRTTFTNFFIKNGNQQSNEILKKTVAPFILRRLKKDVLLELPEKLETPIILELNSKQEKLYNSLHAIARNEVLETIKETGIAQNKIKILSLLTKLRQVCCYPKAIDENFSGKNSKIELLNELVEELISSDHRILVFSQFTTVLKEIEKEFVKKKITTLYLDGKTKSQERQKLTQKFNEDSSISVFLISLKAGGTGLNLTGADTVIHFDPWWNPSIENQASDRAYRMGQNKNVQIIKLICKNTIEEKIVELQNRKQNLINDVLNNEEKAISNLTEQELLNLFDIK